MALLYHFLVSTCSFFLVSKLKLRRYVVRTVKETSYDEILPLLSTIQENVSIILKIFSVSKNVHSVLTLKNITHDNEL